MTAPAPLPRSAWTVLTVVSLAYVLTQLDVAVLAVAVPAIMADLNAPAAHVIWAISAYVLVLAVALITAGRLGDLYGRRRVFLIGVAVFTAASLGAALAQDAGQLVTSRAVQGLGAALLIPQTLALLVDAFPAERRGLAHGISGAAGGLAAVARPALGGQRGHTADWRWVFHLNVPVGVAILLLGRAVLPDPPPGRQARLDLPGVLLATAATGLLAYGITRLAWEPLALAGALAVAFAAQQRRRQHADPLLPFAVLRARNFALSCGFSLAAGATVIGLILVLSLYFQGVAGMDAFRAGLMVVPASLLSAAFDPLAGWLTDRGDSRLLLGGYYALRGLSLLVLPSLFAATAHPSMIIFILFYGLDWVATVPPTVALCREYFGASGAVVFGWVFASHQIGAALAATAAGLVRDRLGDYDWAWYGAGALALLAAILSLMLLAGKRRVGPAGPGIGLAYPAPSAAAAITP